MSVFYLGANTNPETSFWEHSEKDSQSTHLNLNAAVEVFTLVFRIA